MSAFSCRLVAAFVVASGVIAVGASSPAEPAQKKQPRLDRYGDPLPDDVLYRVGATRFRLGWPVSRIAFSKDGKTLLSVSGDAIRHWDTVTGKQRREIVVRDVSRPVLLSPDGKFLAELYERYAYKWANKVGITDVSTGRFLRSLEGRRDSSGIAFAPDNRTLAAADDEGTIYLWDAASGKALGEWKVDGACGGALAFSPDGKVLASDHRGEGIRLWNVSTRRELRRLPAAKETETSATLTFSPDGNLVAAADGQEIRLWDPATGRRLRTIRREGHSNSALIFSPNGKIIASDTDYGVVCLWDAASGKEIRRLGRRVELHDLAFSPDGAYLAVAENNLRLYRVADGEEVRPTGAGTFDLDNAVFSPDGRLLVTTERDGVIRLWDADTGAPLRHFKSRPGCRGVVAFSADGQSLFTRHEVQKNYRTEEHFFQWDLRTGKEQRCLVVPSGATCAAMSSSGRFFAWVSADYVIHLRDVGNKAEARGWPNKAKASWMEGDIGYYPALRFSAQDRWLGFGRRFYGQSDIREVETGARCSFATKDVEYLAFTADGRIAARLLRPKRENIGLQWRTPDDETLITFHDTMTGEELARTDRADVVKLSLDDWMGAEQTAFSPDGRLFVTKIKWQPVRFWETATGKECYRLPEASGLVEQLAFAPDGNKVVTVGASKIAMAWRLFGPLPGQPPVALSVEQQKALWAELASADAAVAFRAIRALTASAPSAVALLQQELHPIPRLDPGQPSRWIAELDSDDFTVREKASAELEKRGLAVEGALGKALRNRPALETRKRLELLLEKLKQQRRAVATIRLGRAIEVLEHLATPEARKLLETLAAGEPQARLTHDAKASLERLAKSERNK